MTSKISKILMEEHKQILKVADAIENECGKIPSEKKINENAIGYANLIKEHIYKEDNILYPMADQSMNKKIQELILKNFEKEEKKMSGEKDKCLKILKELIANE